PRRPVADGGDRYGLVARPGAVRQLPEPEEPRPVPVLDQRPPLAAYRLAELLHLAAQDLVHLVDVDHGARHSEMPSPRARHAARSRRKRSLFAAVLGRAPRRTARAGAAARGT